MVPLPPAMPAKQYPIGERAVSPHLATGVAGTYSALSLEAASYSIPDPAAASPSGSLQAITSLPGCAARVSLDLSELSSGRSGGTKPCSEHSRSPQPLLSPVPFAPAPRASAGRVGTINPLLVPPPAIIAGGPLKKTTPTAGIAEAFTFAIPLAHPQSQSRQPDQQSLHPHPPSYGRWDDQLPGRAPTGCNIRPSIDAAAGAMMLRTCPASELPPRSAAGHLAAEPALAFHTTAASEPTLTVAPPSALPSQCACSTTAAVSAPTGPTADDTPYEWSFGDNLQRARMMARYAAMDAAEELRYEPPDARRDSDVGSRKGRGTWKVLSKLLKSGITRSTSGSGGAAGSGEGPPPVSRQGADGGDDEPAAKVVRSRDSRRLMRVHRSRVGIDRDPTNPLWNGGGIPGAGGKVVPVGKVAAAVLKAATASSSSCQLVDDESVDPATAAVVAAAQALAKITAEGKR